NSNKKNKHRFWSAIGNFVVKRPAIITGSLLIVLLIGILNVPSISFTFNLLKSFPEDMSSRVGFEYLEENYPAGQLAPMTVIIDSDEKIDLNSEFTTNANNLRDSLEELDGINDVTPKVDSKELPEDFLSEDEKSYKFNVVLADNPYETKAINTVEKLRDNETTLLSDAGIDPNYAKLHIEGQTAEQLDV